MNDSSPTREASGVPSGAPEAARKWRRLGLAGFFFFLVKGLLWLAVPVAVAVWRSLAG